MVSFTELLINPIIQSTQKAQMSISEQIKTLEAQLAAVPKTGPQVQVGTKTAQVGSIFGSLGFRLPGRASAEFGQIPQFGEVPVFGPSFTMEELAQSQDIKDQIAELQGQGQALITKIQNLNLVEILKGNPIIPIGLIVIGALVVFAKN